MTAGVFANGHPLFGIPLNVVLILLALAVILYWLLRRKGL